MSVLPNLTGIYLARCTNFLADLVVPLANHVQHIPVHLCLTVEKDACGAWNCPFLLKLMQF